MAPGTPQPGFDHRRGAQPLLRRTSTFRGLFFVGTNLLCFGVLNAFLHYLATGAWLDFSAAAYRQSLAAPLTRMLLAPLNVFAYPWMIPVVGLLVAAVVFVPLMAAVLYRLWVSALFVLIVAAVGHSPLLAATLLLGCAVAAMTRLRSDLPFLALLLGLGASLLAFAALYVLFFPPGPEQMLLPLQRLVMISTFVLALVLALLAGGVVLWLARLTRYRPGVIWPVLMVFLVAPLATFYLRIGAAELEYSLLEAGVACGNEVFLPETLPGCPASLPATASAPTGAPEAVLALARKGLNVRRIGLQQQCLDFLARHEKSRRAPAVRWVLATVTDVGVDERQLARGVLKCVYAGPTIDSRGYWEEIIECNNGTPQAMVARYRLGIDALRQERLEAGIENLRVARAMLSSRMQKLSSAEPPARLFVPSESLPRNEYYRAVLAEIEQVLWLIEANRLAAPDARTRGALAEYMRLWPFDRAEPEPLEALARTADGTPLADNFRFQAAMALSDERRRAAALAELAAQPNESAIAAKYELGRLAIHNGHDPAWADVKLQPAETYFRQVIDSPDSPYRLPAEQHLAWIARKAPGGP